MADYSLEGPRWTRATVTWSVDGSVPPDLVPTIAAAFADWAAVSSLHVQQGAPASADIQITQAPLDGRNGALGLTNYAYSGSSLTSAHITLDGGEGWHATGAGTIVSDGGASLRVTAAHEIGHALGLDHYGGGPAVMNAVLTAAVTGLTASDIHGIQALYGAPAPSAATAVAPVAAGQGATGQVATGQVATGQVGVDHAAADVALLYHGVLGRAPDATGLHAWTHAVEGGTTLASVAQAFLASPEYAALTTGYTNAGYVAALYHDVLGRAGTGGEVGAWAAALDAGTLTRADLARACVTSGEYQGHDAGASDAAYVQGLYAHVLGRAGQAGEVAGWVDALAHGMTRTALAATATGSAEFQAKYVGPGDAAFVDGLYAHALGRPADAGGLAGWVDGLAHGMSRAEVAVAVSEGAEARAYHPAPVDPGWHLA